MIVLDTTVLVYAVGGLHALRAPCQALMRAVGAGRVPATTTAEVIQEFVHVRSRRRSKADAVALGLDYVTSLAPLLTVDDEDLRAGLDLYGTADLGAFDAVLAATALRRGAAALVSADSAFTTVPALRWLDPGSLAFLDDLDSAAGGLA